MTFVVEFVSAENNYVNLKIVEYFLNGSNEVMCANKFN